MIKFMFKKSPKSPQFGNDPSGPWPNQTGGTERGYDIEPLQAVKPPAGDPFEKKFAASNLEAAEKRDKVLTEEQLAETRRLIGTVDFTTHEKLEEADDDKLTGVK